MRAIRLRTNYRVDTYIQGDRTEIGVLLKGGNLRYMPWAGFVEESLDGIGQPVKLKVDAFARNNAWHAEWTVLKPSEYLVGSMYEDRVYIIVPFQVVTAGEMSSTAHDGIMNRR